MKNNITKKAIYISINKSTTPLFVAVGTAMDFHHGHRKKEGKPLHFRSDFSSFAVVNSKRRRAMVRDPRG